MDTGTVSNERGSGATPPVRARGAASSSPFDPGNDAAWRAWRERKLDLAPRRFDDILVEVGDPRALTPAEHAAIVERCRRANMAVYASRAIDEDKAIARRLGEQLGLVSLDANFLADEDGVSSIAVTEAKRGEGFIPYTDRPIRWHTDGYYNPAGRRIRAMVLHCVRSAASGGENALLDHEIAWLLLREQGAELVRALMAPDAMTIPARTDDQGVARAEEAGPVFSVEPDTGDLHMRYTARTRSIRWKDDAGTRTALAALERVLASDSPFVLRGRLEPGMGIVANNVLHERAAFVDDPARPRLLYRARYYERIRGTESSFLAPLASRSAHAHRVP